MNEQTSEPKSPNPTIERWISCSEFYPIDFQAHWNLPSQFPPKGLFLPSALGRDPASPQRYIHASIPPTSLCWKLHLALGLSHGPKGEKHKKHNAVHVGGVLTGHIQSPAGPLRSREAPYWALLWVSHCTRLYGKNFCNLRVSVCPQEADNLTKKIDPLKQRL